MKGRSVCGQIRRKSVISVKAEMNSWRLAVENVMKTFFCLTLYLFIVINPFYQIWKMTLSVSYGDVAQLVRACGSYPQCPGFKSLHRHH